MSEPLDNVPPSLNEDDRFLQSSSYAMRLLNSVDEAEEASTGQLSPSSSLGTTQHGLFEAAEEGFITRRPKRVTNRYGRPMESVARLLYHTGQWIQGPRPPRPYKIDPFLPRVQTAPLVFLQKFFTEQRQKSCLLGAFCLLWVFVFLGVLSRSILGCRIPGHETPVRLSCVSRLWYAVLCIALIALADLSRRSSTFCGVAAANCHPSHNLTFPFRCPADCRGTIISSTETVGDKAYNYRSMVVGGPITAAGTNISIYRGDSFICGAAIHAGILKNPDGGGGVVSLAGEHHDFPAIDANGILSLNFTPSFPVSFTFLEDAGGASAQCRDPRWRLVLITVLFTVTVSIFTTSPSAFFGSTFVAIFFCVALASDPPDFENYMSVVSWAFRGFLPAAFVGLVIYYFCVHHTLNHLSAQIEKTALWLGGCWLGALSNLTFEKLPIQRLTPHDLQQPGAILTLLTIVLVIFLIAIFQAWTFRIEGRMPRYLTFYACIGLLILALTTIPYTNVRIHHYVLALILLPGTTIQTRPSLFFQGLLVGLFINGIARWGFDSILQTPGELFGDDYNSPIPQIAMSSVNSSINSIALSWKYTTSEFDGISVLINDVERFRAPEGQSIDSFNWTRRKEAEPEYFRFAYVKYGNLGDVSIGKFTKPGIWGSDGVWIPPEPEAAG